MAPQVGLEPTTLRLTAGCSAIELLRSVFWGAPGGRAPVLSLFIISSAGVGGNLLRVGYDRIFTC